MLHADYRKALEKITSAPLHLTENDFAALEEFNPADEQRGRDAVRRAQLALLHTKAAPTAPASDAPARFADTIETILRAALRPLVVRVRALDTALADLPALRDRVAALEAPTLPSLDQQIAAFRAGVAADLTAADRPGDLDESFGG